jgi:hypothetical protein
MRLSRFAHLQSTDVQDRPTAFRDVTSVTLEEFPPLVPPCAAAFPAPRATGRRDGKPRTARQLAVYKHGPLPTPEDRLCFLRAYGKIYALPVVQGRLFGMGQSKAHQWMHVLLPVLLPAWRPRGDAPARSLTALAQRLGVSATESAPLVAALAEDPAPVAPPDAPLVPMTGRNDGSSAPRTRLHRKRVRAARQRTTPSKMSCSSMPCFLSSAPVTPRAAAPMRSP